jgi:hypothetical protein
MPADLVDPDHRPLGLQIVELPPQLSLLFVNRQRRYCGYLLWS